MQYNSYTGRQLSQAAYGCGLRVVGKEAEDSVVKASHQAHTPSKARMSFKAFDCIAINDSKK